MNAQISRKTTKTARKNKTSHKLLALALLGFAGLGTTGCEHPLSTLFNAQGETARAAMEEQTELMSQILEDNRRREEELLARLDEEDQEEMDECEEETGEPCPEEEPDFDECEEETGEPCPDEQDIDLDDDDPELALGEGDELNDGLPMTDQTDQTS